MRGVCISCIKVCPECLGLFWKSKSYRLRLVLMAEFFVTRPEGKCITPDAGVARAREAGAIPLFP